MTTFTEAYQRYDRSNRDNRADLWTLCECTYAESQTSTLVHLAEIIGLSDRIDSVGDWCKVGWLIAYCGYVPHYKAEDGSAWNLLSMWERSDALSYDHLLRMAKQAKRHELDPLEVLERLYHAMDGQKAESLERDIEEAHEPQAELLRRDWKRVNKRVTQNIDSFILRGVSEIVREKWDELCKLIESDVKRLEAE